MSTQYHGQSEVMMDHIVPHIDWLAGCTIEQRLLRERISLIGITAKWYQNNQIVGFREMRQMRHENGLFGTVSITAEKGKMGISQA